MLLSTIWYSFTRRALQQSGRWTANKAFRLLLHSCHVHACVCDCACVHLCARLDKAPSERAQAQHRMRMMWSTFFNGKLMHLWVMHQRLWLGWKIRFIRKNETISHYICFWSFFLGACLDSAADGADFLDEDEFKRKMRIEATAKPAGTWNGCTKRKVTKRHRLMSHTSFSCTWTKVAPKEIPASNKLAKLLNGDTNSKMEAAISTTPIAKAKCVLGMLSNTGGKSFWKTG